MSDSVWFAGPPCPVLLRPVELEEKPPLVKFYIKNTSLATTGIASFNLTSIYIQFKMRNLVIMFVSFLVAGEV